MVRPFQSAISLSSRYGAVRLARAASSMLALLGQQRFIGFAGGGRLPGGAAGCGRDNCRRG